MRRRDFLGVLGGAAAWPVATHAQQAGTRRIGVLIGRSETDADGQKQAAAFERGLRELGWLPRQNIEIEYRWQTSDPRQRLAFAKEIVALNPDIVVANSTPYLTAARQASPNIPIVFVAIADPVAQGFIQSLARPGGVITGFGVEEPAMGAKWVELLKELVPRIDKITAIFNPDGAPFARMFVPSIEAVLSSGQPGLTIAPVRNEGEAEQAIAASALRPTSGLIFLPDSFLASHREFIVGTVAKHRVPAIYSVSPFARSGGLIAYGIDRAEIFYRAASYVDRVLRGARPGDLPVQMPTKFELAINMKSAQALGLTVPPSLLARADEVIE